MVTKDNIKYYIKTDGWKREVDFCVAMDMNTVPMIEVEFYSLKDIRTINGIPYKEFETPTKWQKLPKGWSYDTKLFDVRWELSDAEREIMSKCSINDREKLAELINEGSLVPENSKDHSHMQTEITKDGWRIIRVHDKYVRTYAFVYKEDLYDTYEEAKEVVSAYEAELKRQSELTDLEWSIEQIQKTINRWSTIYGIAESEKQRIEDFIMGLDNLIDVEVRLFCGVIQWKYWKNKKWRDIV